MLRADSFDVPLKKKVVDFGPSPYVGGYRIRLSCYFYRAFVFEDSAYEVKWAKKKVVDAPFNRLRINKTSDARLSLRYLRVVEAGCDLSREEAVCWQKVKNKLDLKNSRMPVCRDYTGRPTPYESAIAYPVEVFLFPQPSTKTIAGPVKCWPVD